MRDRDINLLFDNLNHKTVAYNKIYAVLTGRAVTGLILSQLIYWASVKNYEEFYKTDEELCEELGTSVDEVKGARKALSKLSFFYSEKKGLPARTFYKIDKEKLIEAVLSISYTNNCDIKPLQYKEKVEKSLKIPVVENPLTSEWKSHDPLYREYTESTLANSKEFAEDSFSSKESLTTSSDNLPLDEEFEIWVEKSGVKLIEGDEEIYQVPWRKTPFSREELEKYWKLSTKKVRSGKPQRVDSHILAVFACFKGFVPTYQDSYPSHWLNNKTQRQYASFLYEDKGLDKIKKILALYKKLEDSEFKPVINSPYDLQVKWPNLVSLIKKS